MKRVRLFLGMLLMGAVALLLTACGGGGGGTAAPPAPSLSLAFGIKTLQFSWAAVSEATHYRLFENPDGVSGFTQTGADLPAGTTATTREIAVHRHNWAAARYLLEACNATGCSSSNEVNTAGAVLAAIGYFKASNTGVGDQFGFSIALSGDGNTLAVGAYLEDSGATGINGNQADTLENAGAVYIFTRAGGTWFQQAYVKASNTGEGCLIPLSCGGDFFGYSIALNGDGNTLAVGAILEASAATGINGNQADNSASFAGAVYVFTRSGGTWSQQAYVKASNTGAADFFGLSVALSADGNTLAVGATGEASAAIGINGNQADNSLTNAGAVYLFTRTSSTWGQQAYVKASNTGSGDGFGRSVTLSSDGNTLGVGADREASAVSGINGNQADNSAAASGAVYVFTRTAGIWSQQAYVKASNTNGGDQFGESVTLSGDGNTLAVGANLEASAATGINGNQADNSASGAGAVYVFTRTGSTWSQQAYIKASNAETGDFFGWRLGLSSDGNILTVGAVGEASLATGINGDETDDGAFSTGAVYVYNRSGSSWSQQAYVKASNTTAGGGGFGISVALSGDGQTLAVGAVGEDSDATGIGGDQTDHSAALAGAVYLY